MAKKLTFASLVIFGAIMIPILIIGFVKRDKNTNSLNANFQNAQNADLTVNTVNSTATALTVQEVLKHNSVSDCWMIINNKVYILTDFLNVHSGGASAMVLYCGKDGTNAFDTKDRVPAKSHQQGDSDILQNYFIGDLNQSVFQNIIQNVSSATKTVNFREDGDDNDD